MRAHHALLFAALPALATLASCRRDRATADRGVSSNEGGAAAVAGFDASAASGTPACVAKAPASPHAAGVGTLVCTFPSGRVCAGTSDGGSLACECDDDCNECTCGPGNLIGTTLAACGSGDGSACTGPVSAQCTHGAIGYPCGDALPRVAYCPPWVRQQCGAGVCPDSACRLSKLDRAGGSVWCCPR